MFGLLRIFIVLATIGYDALMDGSLNSGTPERLVLQLKCPESCWL